MKIDVITLFPEMFDAVRDCGISRIAFEKNAMAMKCYNPRDFSSNKHRSVDDRPYGGGPGMVMMPQPLADCIDLVMQNNAGPVIYLSPQGEKLDQALVTELSTLDQVVFLCGRYEGIDERILRSRVDREISVGDYVLAGGELPAMVIIEAVSRLLPDVLGNDLSAVQDSFSDGLLDCQHFTRPEEFEGMAVPKVLLGGNHAEIARWRLKQSLERTEQRRPDLLSGRQVDSLTTKKAVNTEEVLLKEQDLEQDDD